MAWHGHSDSDINSLGTSVAPVKPIGQQKQASTSSAASNAAAGIGSLAKVGKAIVGKIKGSSKSPNAPYGSNSD